MYVKGGLLWLQTWNAVLLCIKNIFPVIAMILGAVYHWIPSPSCPFLHFIFGTSSRECFTAFFVNSLCCSCCFEKKKKRTRCRFQKNLPFSEVRLFRQIPWESLFLISRYIKELQTEKWEIKLAIYVYKFCWSLWN